MQLTTNLKRQMQVQIGQVFQNVDPQRQLNDILISDLAAQASKDNLELGCKMIKQAVIQKALTKVREDPQIQRAIEIRKMAPSAAEFRASSIDPSHIA